MKAVFKIAADGKDITDAIANRLESLTLKDERGWDSDTLDIVLDDRPDLQGNYIEMPRKGVSLTVSLGYDGKLHQMGVFVVGEIRSYGAAERLTITATSIDVKSSLTELRTRGLDDVTLNDLVGTVAAEHGYESRVAATLQSVLLKRVDQLDESDLNMLRRVCRQHGAVLKYSAGVIAVVERGKSRTVSGKELPSIAISKTDLVSWDFTFADRDKYSSVVVVYRDTAEAKDTRVTAGSGRKRKTLRMGVSNKDEAYAIAEAKLRDLNRGASTARVTTKGDARYIAETWVDLQGMRPGLNGRWEIASATHSLNKANGWITTLDLEING